MSKNSLTFRASQHIKEFRLNNSTGKKMSQEEAAEALGISVSSLKRFENGSHAPSARAAKVMQSFTGIIYPYWKGETDCKTWEAYKHERIVAAQADKKDKEYRKTLQEEINRRETLFASCGYRYTYLTSAQVDFAGIDPANEYSDATEQHCIASFQNLSQKTYLSTNELEALITELRETIAFTCFKKGRNAKTDITSLSTK